MIDNVTAPIAGFALRVGLGVMFLAHAWLKIAVFTLAGNAAFFESIGLPGALGDAVFAAELVGGILLIAGVWPRAVALILLPVLLGAAWAHAGNGWLFTNANGGWEYPAFLVLAACVQVLIGDGAFTLVRTPRLGSPVRTDVHGAT